jgi:hypothetical protein
MDNMLYCRGCLDVWRSAHMDGLNFSRCAECLQSYTIASRIPDTEFTRRERRKRIFYNTLKDFSIAFGFIQIIIILLSLLTFAMDSKKM